MINKKYYLDTNALYSIRKISDQRVAESFTSSLTILELIAGLKDRPEKYAQRRALLEILEAKKLMIDWVLPQQLLYEAFDLSKSKPIKDLRNEILGRLMTLVINCDSVDEFIDEDQRLNGDGGFVYLSTVEQKWSGTLMRLFPVAQSAFKTSLLGNRQQRVMLNGKWYDTNTKNKFIDAALSEFEATKRLSISAFTSDFLTGPLAVAGATKEIVVASYNGLVDHFVDAFTRYMLDVLLGAAPSKNDMVDLHHLTYLRHYHDCYMVSDDKLFDRYFREKTVRVSEIL
jgi:predicted nucleic acid-binding protein